MSASPNSAWQCFGPRHSPNSNCLCRAPNTAAVLTILTTVFGQHSNLSPSRQQANVLRTKVHHGRRFLKLFYVNFRDWSNDEVVTLRILYRPENTNKPHEETRQEHLSCLYLSREDTLMDGNIVSRLSIQGSKGIWQWPIIRCTIHSQ